MVNDVTLQEGTTAVLVLADGTILQGQGAGRTGICVGEVCFNTAMTGYQEILTDPSYAQQILCFTFPHIGNVGTNPDDEEATAERAQQAAVGAIFKAPITPASSWRSKEELGDWLDARGIIAISGIDTRALTAFIRDKGMPSGVIAHDPKGAFDLAALHAKARDWVGLTGADLARDVHTTEAMDWDEGVMDVTNWAYPKGYAEGDGSKTVALIDYGVKRNILRALVAQGLRVRVFPATASVEEILSIKPDGVVLSNGPGDPAATGEHALPVIRGLLETGVPMLGICLGHQMLALALGAKTVKMEQGHHGANHPVKDYTTGKVEIVSMNHGFAVDRESLPKTVEETHVSLFDGTNCGIAVVGKPVFSVQHHPEASPGPRDSDYLFKRFADAL